MKKLLKLMFLIVFAVQVYAQKGGITGTVTDKFTGEKIPFASVSVFEPGFDKIVSGSVSDENGNFTVQNLHQGTFPVVVSFIGYSSDTINSVVISGNNSRINLGSVQLAPAAIEIEDVEVKAMANTSARKIDRQTYKANDFETAKGGTAVDILNKLPSVSVDPDGNVSVRGTTDFMVYLNGKPTQMDASVLLAQIAANSIENIDVITVPTARFDAQGKGGIINISTKKKGQEGFSVSANGLYGDAPWAHKDDKYSGYEMTDQHLGGGVNLLIQKEKLTLYGSVNYNKRNVNGFRTGDARLLQSDGSYYHMVAGGERPEWYETYSASAGLDYLLNEKSTLSASYYFGNRNDGRSAFYVYNNFFGDVNKNPIQGVAPQNHWIYNPNTDTRFGIFHTGNIDWNIKYENKSELRLSVLIEHSELWRELQNENYNYSKPTESVHNKLLEFKQTDDTPLNGFRFSAEYEKAFDDKSRLSVGFQPQFVHQEGGFIYDTLNVSSGVWRTNSKFNNDVEMNRNIYAGFVDYSAEFGKLLVKAGLRLEYTDQLLKIGNPDYLNIFERPTKPEYKVQQLDWFPTLHSSYAFNETDALIFAASRRINRPPTKNMAPFLYRRHYEVYEVGDPELKPEYMNNAELSFNKKVAKQSFTLTGFYRGTDNAVFRANTVYEEENVLIRSFTNSGNVQALGAELNANLVAGKKAKFFVGGSLYNFRVKGNVFGYTENNQSTNWSLKGNMNLLLAKSLKFTVDFDVKSASVTSQGRNEMFYLSNTALNYTPEKLKGWDFSMKVLDILGSNLEALNTRAFNAQGIQIFYQEVEYDRVGPIVEINASYTLNMNGKNRKKTESTFGKEQF